jgi:hypothetical protein
MQGVMFMSTLAGRARLCVASLLVLGGPLVAAQPAGAHTCAKVSVFVAGGEIPVGSCHPQPGDPGDLCTGIAVTPAGTGAGYLVCVKLP